MTDTAEQRHVWTYNDSPEWLARNTGIPDMMLTNGMAERDAMKVAERMAVRYPDDTFEVRNVRGETEHTYGPVRRELRPARTTPRRTLGRGVR